MLKKMLIGFAASVMLVGCQTGGDLNTYDSDEYSFMYSDDYAIEEATEAFPAVTARADFGRVEIFKMEDFGDRPFGVSGEETQEEIDGYMPKDQQKAGDYDVWVFYGEGDEEGKATLQEVVDSIEIK